MNNTIIALFIILTFSSCFTERIDIDLNEQNEKIVITGWITDLDESQYVKIFKSSNYLGNDPVVFVTDADVVINDNSNSYQLEQQKEGHYFLPMDWTAKPGDTYSLVVRHDNNEYTATYTMSPCPEIEEASYLAYNDLTETDSIRIYETTFGFQETPGEGDAYYAIDYAKGSLEGDTLFNGGYADDSFQDGLFFDDIRISEDDRLFKINDIAIIELYSIGQDASDYLFDIESEVFRGGPFDPPPANVRTNLTGGAVGFFIASGAKRVELLID